MLVLNNVTLIDGKGGKPIPKSTVIIRGNRFEHVGSEISYPDDANVIDLHDLTVMPGLIDCHLHRVALAGRMDKILPPRSGLAPTLINHCKSGYSTWRILKTGIRVPVNMVE